MSIRVMTQVWDHSTQKGSALLLLLALADHAADDGFCWPGIERLAKRVRMSSRSVMRKIQDLENSKEIAVVRQLGQHNWYVVSVGMTDDEVKDVFATRKLQWEAGPVQKRGERQGVYVIGGDGYYKIGHATDIDRRISQLKVQSPFPVETICVIEGDDYAETERKLHEHYAAKRTNGEWFRLTSIDIEALKTFDTSDNSVTPDIQVPTSDKNGGTSDKNDKTTDIAMSDEPSLEPSLEPSEEKQEGATAPPPPEPPAQDDDSPSEEKEPEKTGPPQAIAAYRAVFHSYPRKETYGFIVTAVGSRPDRLQLWTRICTEWLLRGYNKYNIRGLIDCFHKGQVGNGRHDKQGGGIDEFLEIAAELGAQERAAAYGD